MRLKGHRALQARSKYLIRRARKSSSMLPHYLLLVTITVTALGQTKIPVADTPFEQDVHESYPLPTSAENDVRSIAVEPSGRVWAATGAGVRYLEGGNWKKPLGGAEIGPVYAIHRDASGVLWAGAWNGLYTVTPEAVNKPVISDTLISAIGEYDDSKTGEVTLVAAGPHGIWHIDGKVAKRIEARTQTSIRAVLPVRGDKIWVGTASGLFLLDLSRNPVLCTRYSGFGSAPGWALRVTTKMDGACAIAVDGCRATTCATLRSQTMAQPGLPPGQE